MDNRWFWEKWINKSCFFHLNLWLLVGISPKLFCFSIDPHRLMKCLFLIYYGWWITRKAWAKILCLSISKLLWIYITQLWNPFLYIPRIGIILLGLCKRIENPERSWICSCRGTPLPTSIVLSRIIVDEILSKVLFSPSPIYQEILCEVGSYHHPSSIMHPASMIELAHSRIDKGNTGFSSTPCLKLLLVIDPIYMLCPR